MSEKYKFECGCEFPILGLPVGNSKIPRIDLDLDIENINLQCPITWKLMSQGTTTGVFQLESNLGKQYSKKLKPENIEHLAALNSLLRPGSLKAYDEKGVSMTDHYCLRKNNEEETIIKYKELEDILNKTYNVIAYQEQCLQIAIKLADFNEIEADALRKGIGKKLPEEIAKVKKIFLEKGEKAGVLPKEALEEVFGWIEKSQRYSFNKSITLDTMLQLKDKNISIKDIKIGDLIKAPKNISEDYYVEVINKFDHGEQNIYEIILSSGKNIKCTLHHKFLCEDNIIRPLWLILKDDIKILCEDE